MNKYTQLFLLFSTLLPFGSHCQDRLDDQEVGFVISHIVDTLLADMEVDYFFQQPPQPPAIDSNHLDSIITIFDPVTFVERSLPLSEYADEYLPAAKVQYQADSILWAIRLSIGQKVVHLGYEITPEFEFSIRNHAVEGFDELQQVSDWRSEGGLDLSSLELPSSFLFTPIGEEDEIYYKYAAAGRITFSRVHFNANKSRAVVFVKCRFQTTSREEVRWVGLYRLRLFYGQWKVFDRQSIW